MTTLAVRPAPSGSDIVRAREELGPAPAGSALASLSPEDLWLLAALADPAEACLPGTAPEDTLYLSWLRFVAPLVLSRFPAFRDAASALPPGASWGAFVRSR